MKLINHNYEYLSTHLKIIKTSSEHIGKYSNKPDVCALWLTFPHKKVMLHCISILIFCEYMYQSRNIEHFSMLT